MFFKYYTLSLHKTTPISNGQKRASLWMRATASHTEQVQHHLINMSLVLITLTLCLYLSKTSGLKPVI